MVWQPMRQLFIEVQMTKIKSIMGHLSSFNKKKISYQFSYTRPRLEKWENMLTRKLLAIFTQYKCHIWLTWTNDNHWFTNRIWTVTLKMWQVETYLWTLNLLITWHSDIAAQNELVFFCNTIYLIFAQTEMNWGATTNIYSITIIELQIDCKRFQTIFSHI